MLKYVSMQNMLTLVFAGNNSYIFPGVALALIVTKAVRAPNALFLVAAEVCLPIHFSVGQYIT